MKSLLGETRPLFFTSGLVLMDNCTLSLHVYGYFHAYVLFSISLCFWADVAELLFHIWMEATSNRDLTLRCVSSTQQQHKLFSWSLWAFRCEELLLHAFSLPGSFREQIWASGFLSTSLCLRMASIKKVSLERFCTRICMLTFIAHLKSTLNQNLMVFILYFLYAYFWSFHSLKHLLLFCYNFTQCFSLSHLILYFSS